jgi:ADP-ribose pyrophosphatase
VDGEDIRVHRVPFDDVPRRIAAWRAEGFAIDVKLLLLLGGELAR